MRPQISIITVVYNGKELLEKTINSIVSQSSSNYEYLIIDGGSTDGTLDIIKKYSDKINYWISEKDKGIYDAMNKGIEAAKGEYILFLNAGDELYAPDVLKTIFSKSPEADIFYGETVLTDDEKELGTRSELSTRKLPENLTWKSLSKGMVVCHQSFIVRKELIPFYDMQYKLSSDIDWVIKCLKNSKNTVNTHLIISKYLIGGYSVKNIRKSWTERFIILKKHFGLLSTLCNHFYIALRFFIRKGNKKY